MGLTTSKSDSQTSNLNQQLSSQGSSGNQSPTVTAAGNVTYQDAGGDVSLAALQGMGDVVKLALTKQSELLSDSLGQAAQANATQAVNDTQLLSSVLSANQQLAQNSQTGGATAAIKQSNYLIWGLLGLAGLLVFFFMRHK